MIAWLRDILPALDGTASRAVGRANQIAAGHPRLHGAPETAAQRHMPRMVIP